MVNLTQMRVQLNGQEQILIQAAFVLTKIAPMALTVDDDWFQLRFFITGNQIIVISDQFVSPVCSSVMNFLIVTTSALFCDSMIAEITQIGDVRKIPCREIFSAGDSCLYGPCALILNCFVISAVHWIRSFSLGQLSVIFVGRDDLIPPHITAFALLTTTHTA